MMHVSQNKSQAVDTRETLLCGVFTKKDSVATIVGGCRHIHSATLGPRDPAAKQTQDALDRAIVPVYSWEQTPTAAPMILGNSADRAALIQEIVVSTGIAKKRFLKEKVTYVLEELITNALYHAYRNPAGKEKYARSSRVTLSSEEALTVRSQVTPNGIWLSVSDQAGSLAFKDVAMSLHRCYETKNQIENKEGGAGLGTYMVFDAVTHLKFVTIPGHSTVVSCWIADQRSYDPQAFSFNYFEGRK